MCTICSIKNPDLISAIENLLEEHQGVLSVEDKKKLKQLFPDFADQIDNINNNDCKLHWNFHQSISREPVVEKTSSLKDDINKDEATVLSELLNKQAATFNCLTRKINKALEDLDSDPNAMIVHPNTLEFYGNLAISIRATVKEIRELNVAINGAKDGAMEGLKALAKALHPENSTEESIDLTTTEYDD